MSQFEDLRVPNIAFIGNYLPRQCGIATFTTDLCEAIATEYDGTTCLVRLQHEYGIFGGWAASPMLAR
jgi:hypothetical protein